MKQSRSIVIGNNAREHILRGALTLAKTVAVTFGPMGRNTIIDRFSGMLSTRDGVTVAREIDLPDPLENQGCQILKQACVKVNDEVGDGTTQTAILAAEMLREGNRLIAAGFPPGDIVLGLKKATEHALWAIQEMSVPVKTQEQIQQIAFLASNRDTEISALLAEAVMAVGKDGLVVIEDGQGVKSSLELKEGMEIENGMANPAFSGSSEKIERIVEAPLVAVINVHLRSV
ncbi:MAG: TCP-1/cpn60 chaperonin family protein, partial [Bacteroidota bacterium]